MDRLFLDANVLFTAALTPGGKAAFLVAQASSPASTGPTGLWSLYTTAYAIEEARRNLRAKQPRAEASLERVLERMTVLAQPAQPLTHLQLRSKDVPIWAAAQAGRVTHLLTGDLRDFGALMNRPRETGGIVIQTVADYLAARLRR